MTPKKKAMGRPRLDARGRAITTHVCLGREHYELLSKVRRKLQKKAGDRTVSKGEAFRFALEAAWRELRPKKRGAA